MYEDVYKYPRITTKHTYNNATAFIYTERILASSVCDK